MRYILNILPQAQFLVVFGPATSDQVMEVINRAGTYTFLCSDMPRRFQRI